MKLFLGSFYVRPVSGNYAVGLCLCTATPKTLHFPSISVLTAQAPPHEAFYKHPLAHTLPQPGEFDTMILILQRREFRGEKLNIMSTFTDRVNGRKENPIQFPSPG